MSITDNKQHRFFRVVPINPASLEHNIRREKMLKKEKKIIFLMRNSIPQLCYHYYNFAGTIARGCHPATEVDAYEV